MAETLQPLIERALHAYLSLAELGETIDEEWSYVTDLSDAWQLRLREVAEQRGTEPVPEAAGAAVERAIAEIGLIGDPHRAIDWLSTFPQVVLLALDETP